MNQLAQNFAQTLKDEPRFDPRGRQVHRTIKLWEQLSHDVEALVSNTAISRNEIMNRLIEIGLHELKTSLDSDMPKFFGVELHDDSVRRRAVSGEVD